MYVIVAMFFSLSHFLSKVAKATWKCSSWQVLWRGWRRRKEAKGQRSPMRPSWESRKWSFFLIFIRDGKYLTGPVFWTRTGFWNPARIFEKGRTGPDRFSENRMFFSPRTGPDRFKRPNVPQMIPEWSPNDAQMTPKWSQMTPKWSPNDARMTPEWPPNDAQMIPKWSPNDAQMMSKWSPNDPQMMPK